MKPRLKFLLTACLAAFAVGACTKAFAHGAPTDAESGVSGPREAIRAITQALSLVPGDTLIATVNAAAGQAPAGHKRVTLRDTLYLGDSLYAVVGSAAIAPPPPPPPPPPSGTWNLPAGWTIVCQTGAVTTMAVSGSNYGFAGPHPCTWAKGNDATGSIALASAASVDRQASGYRVTFPAGAVLDPAWRMYTYHTTAATRGTGSYYIGWKQRWQPRGSYAALLAALHSADSKAWSPKDDSGDNLTIMSFLTFSVPVIGLNFQGADGNNIPNNNSSAPKAGTVPATAAMVLPGVAAGNGAWDQEEVIIRAAGSLSASSVQFYVNGKLVASASGVTDAKAWTASEQYLSRSVYGGTESGTTYTDIDSVTIAVH